MVVPWFSAQRDPSCWGRGWLKCQGTTCCWGWSWTASGPHPFGSTKKKAAFIFIIMMFLIVEIEGGTYMDYARLNYITEWRLSWIDWLENHLQSQSFQVNFCSLLERRDSYHHITYYCLFFPETQVVGWEGNKEEDSCDVLKTVDPLLSLWPLTSNINNSMKPNESWYKIHDTINKLNQWRGLYTRPQHIPVYILACNIENLGIGLLHRNKAEYEDD